MNERRDPDRPVVLTVELFQPRPNILYSLDTAARLAAVSRRTLLRYCRAGLVHPSFQPPYGVMLFSEETVRAVRAIERLRAVEGLEFWVIKTLMGLLGEVEQLRAELRFLRSR
mgnify:CR=1 FL=1